MHGEIPGHTVLGDVHPVGALNKTNFGHVCAYVSMYVCDALLRC